MRKLVLFTCLLFWSQLGLAAQPSVGMLDFGEVPVSRIDNQDPTLAEVRKDVIMGAMRLGWELQGGTDSESTLRYAKPDYDVTIRVKFTTKTIKFEYVSSNGLGYEKRENGETLIHPSYNRWIANLVKSISPMGLELRLKNASATSSIPDNALVIHYRRSDTNYKQWGLHVWGNAVEAPTSWFKPVVSTQRDTFGAIYTVKADAAALTSDEVEAYFMPHSGETRDPCSQDFSWDPRKGREIFVVSGDCKIYFSVDEAMTSRRLR